MAQGALIWSCLGMVMPGIVWCMTSDAIFIIPEYIGIFTPKVTTLAGVPNLSWLLRNVQHLA